MESAATLEDLSRHFELRLEKISKVIHLVHLGPGSKGHALLAKLSRDVAEIEATLKEIRALGRKRRNDVAELRMLQLEMVEVNRQLVHQLSHLPKHLPSQQHSDPPAPPLRERQTSGDGGDRSPHKSSKSPRNIPSISYVTKDEFDQVPKYIRGRQSYDKVNCGIAELNKAIFSKYKIMKCPKSTMNDKTRYKYNLYKEQENEQTKGEYFCCEEDIKAFTSLKMDHVGRGLMTLLRHVHRVREIRGNNLTRYAVVR